MRYNELKALYILSISGVIENAWGKWSSPDFMDIQFSAVTISSLVARQLATFHVFGGHGQQMIYSTRVGDTIADIFDEELKKAGENPDDFVLHNESSSYKLYHSVREKERIFSERRKEITKAVNRRLKNIRPTPLALDGASAPKASGDLLADVLDGEGTLPEPPRQ